MILNIIISDKSSNNLNYKLKSACDEIFLCPKLNKVSNNIEKTFNIRESALLSTCT